MRCMSLQQFGAALVEEERPVPVAAGQEIVLRVLAAGVCHSDLHVREGGYYIGHGQNLSFAARGMQLPLVLGHETVGEVWAAGPDVEHVKVGERYVVYSWNGCGECEVCSKGAENLCAKPRFLGIHRDGGYSQMIKVPHSRYLFPLGATDPVSAAPLPCSGATAYGAIKKVLGEVLSAPVVVIGAGGLGLMCINLISAVGGFRPVVIDVSEEKRAAAIAGGAAAAFNGMDSNVITQVQEFIGRPPAAVIDFVGSEQTAALSFDMIGKGGKIVIVGLFGGAAPWPLPMLPLKSVTIMGSYMGTMPEFAELMALVHEGKVASIPTRQTALSQADATLNQLERGAVIGRAVLVPDI